MLYYCSGGKTTAIARHVNFAQIRLFVSKTHSALRCLRRLLQHVKIINYSLRNIIPAQECNV